MNPVFRLLLLSLLLQPGLAWAASAWNFTPEHFARLRQAGGELRFSPDSQWFPFELRRNLLVTLNYVLDPQLSPASTEGVNLEDFYHGHLACKGQGSAILFRDKFEQVHRHARVEHGLKPQAWPTVQNFDTYVSALKQAETEMGKLLVELLSGEDCGELVVIYHTFEFSKPEVKKGDPRRNLIFPLSASSPFHFQPPNINDASSVLHHYDYIVHFGFLIDDMGEIHVTLGSRFELSKVIGAPVEL